MDHKQPFGISNVVYGKSSSFQQTTIKDFPLHHYLFSCWIMDLPTLFASKLEEKNESKFTLILPPLTSQTCKIILRLRCTVFSKRTFIKLLMLNLTIIYRKIIKSTSSVHTKYRVMPLILDIWNL